MTRIALWPKSAVGPNMQGQPPSMTVMPCSRPYAVAVSETLPAPGRGHPDPLDPELGALAHRFVGELGTGADHDGLDAARDRSEVVVGPVALDLVGVRVDGEDLIAAVAQPLVDGVAAVAARARETPVTATRL